MGLICSDMELISSDDLALERRGYVQEDKVRKMKVSVLVDSGAMMLSVNETIKVQLGLSVFSVPPTSLTVICLIFPKR